MGRRLTNVLSNSISLPKNMFAAFAFIWVANLYDYASLVKE